VILKLPVALLPALSVASQLTAFSPRANVEPEAGVHVTDTEPSIASDAEAVKVTIAPLAPLASTVMSAGTLRTGGALSSTVTVKVAVAVLPALSVAEHVTLVEPIAKVESEAGLQLGLIAPSTASDAEAVNVTTAPSFEVASTVMSAGTVTTGTVLS
jgi:hypothetical protein